MTDNDDIRVVRGNPTSEELAAVVSVLEAMAAEHSGTRVRRMHSSADGWVLSQRPIRTPIVPGVTRWSSFS